MGYSRKNSNRGGWGYTFLKPPLEFFIFLFYPWKFQTKQSSTLDISQNCVRSTGNSKVKNKDPWKFHIFFFGHPWKFHIFFLVTLGNFTSFLINPKQIPHGIYLITLEIPYPQHPPTLVWIFSWIAHFTDKACDLSRDFFETAFSAGIFGHKRAQ